MSLSCINIRSKEFLDLQKESGLYTHELEFMVARWQEINNQLDIFPNLSQLQPEVFYSKVTNSSEAIIASEKTIRDLAARMADRIGMKVVFEADQTKEYKGRIDYQPKGFGTRDEDYNASETVAIINLAHATLDTPIHEILGHPIIRAIKNRQTKPDVILPIGTSGSGKSTFIKSLPQENLVVIEPDAMRVEFTGDMNDKSKDKEIYIEAANRAVQAIKQGKQVVFDTTNLTIDKRLPFVEAIKKAIPDANIQYKLMELNPELAKQRIKAQLARGENRAAVSDATIDRHAESYKQMLDDIKNEPISNFDEKTSLYQNLIKELETGKGKEVLDRIKRDYIYKVDSKRDLIIKQINDLKFEEKNYIKWGEKEALESVRERKQTLEKELENYAANKYTLEEQQEEALVELLGLMTANKLDNVKDGKLISLLKRLLKEIKAFVRNLLNQKEVEIDKLPDNMTINDLADILAYSNSKLILPGHEVVYTTPDNNKFKTYSEASKHISELSKSIKNVDLDNVGLLKEKPIYKIGDYFGQYEKGFVEEKGLNKIESQEEADYLNSQEYRIEEPTTIRDFIEKNKEYEQSKEIIEEWKKVNNIQYNPEEIYSRGQEFVSVVGAYSSFDVNLIMQNLLHHIEDNEKAGGKFALSAFTKPINKTISHLEGGGGKIKFKIYPQSEDILWASNTDVYSGSVWDASEKINKDKKSELLGVAYTKYPSLRSINTVQPNLAAVIDDLAHHHNELGIVLTGNNFRLEYDDNIPHATKKIIDSVNSILDKKYGKIDKPKIKSVKRLPIITDWRIMEGPGGKGMKFAVEYVIEYADADIEFFETEEEANDFIKERTKNSKDRVGIQPTQTNETLKESIDSVKNKLDNRNNLLPTKFLTKGKSKGYSGDTWFYKENGEWYMKYVPYDAPFDTEVESYDITKMSDAGLSIDEVWESYIKENPSSPVATQKEKEYTSQALINTKIAALKEVAKKYPRSLIRSEVKPIKPFDTDSYTQFNDELPFQKISQSLSKEQLDAIDNVFDENPELADAVYEALGLEQYSDIELKPYATDIWGKVPKQRGDNNFVNKEQYSVKINTENRGIDVRLTIYFDDSNKTAFVSNIENFENDVTHPLKKGLGLKAFLEANKLIIEKGYTPVIDNLVSGYGYDMMLKLEKQGYLLKVLNKNVSNSQYDNVKYENPPFVFTNKIYDNQITPQQEQQALQLYSPNSKVKDIVYHGTRNTFDKFEKRNKEQYSIENETQTNSLLNGIFFTDRNTALDNYTDENKILKSVILNMQNPLLSDDRRQVSNKNIKNQDGVITIEFIGNSISDVYVVFEPEQIHILGAKQDIENFKEFVNNNNQKTKDYFSNEINKIQEESKIIENSLKEYETSKKIDNRNTTKAIKNKEEKTKETNNKLLSLGFEFINENEYQFSTSSYITFKSKLNSLEGIDVSINTFKSPDYLIKIKIAPLKNNFDLQKQGELPFNPIELKLALKENDFIQDIADNTFEGLTEEQINILRDNLENGELNLNCKI